MTIPRIYSPQSLENKTTCELGEDTLKYLRQVMRLKQGDRINIFDGFGHEFEALIQNYSLKTVIIELGKPVPSEAREIKIILAQALPKARKMDTIIKSAAELGTDRIIPFHAARSVSQIGDEKSELKLSRWRKIAQEAARSSHSAYITHVSKISSFSEMLSLSSQSAWKFIFWEEESQKTIKDVLTDASLMDAKDFFIVVGPEGGFSRDEITRAKDAGFISLSLGKQILKVETAGAAILSIIQYEKGIFSRKTQEVTK
ncbi:MAG TPA: RsmE family RNA methyltransferase [Smithella sp.]|nr:16S rRNA (uracil(1498)-N(3))-methyltransferase [Smithella sp.]MDM7987354.1 RsmE family RNA methyltransferase [Smithella sp.]HNY49745.1 RsmE family RNA methyltransferase [Smithella sp.]HOG90821.1 RsmE family RNA methyltransferase [Smithella sp.]HOU51618.1 RsmE family RNA methyltransferase [Smithella sp.]